MMKAGIQSDVWALGCTVYEIRAGSILFPCFWGDWGEVLQEIVNSIGKLPSPWHEESAGWIKSDTPPERSLLEKIKAIDDEPESSSSRKTILMDTDRLPCPKMSAEEVASMYDLLSKMLRYNTEQRISAEEVSYHPWCNSQFEKTPVS